MGDNSLFRCVFKSSVCHRNSPRIMTVGSCDSGIWRPNSRISLYYSLLAGNLVRRTVRRRLHPPPRSLSCLISLAYIDRSPAFIGHFYELHPPENLSNYLNLARKWAFSQTRSSEVGFCNSQYNQSTSPRPLTTVGCPFFPDLQTLGHIGTRGIAH